MLCEDAFQGESQWEPWKKGSWARKQAVLTHTHTHTHVCWLDLQQHSLCLLTWSGHEKYFSRSWEVGHFGHHGQHCWLGVPPSSYMPTFPVASAPLLGSRISGPPPFLLLDYVFPIKKVLPPFKNITAFWLSKGKHFTVPKYNNLLTFQSQTFSFVTNNIFKNNYF